MATHNFWTWLAKPYRLVTIALSIVMATVFTFNVIYGGGALDETLPGETLAWAAGVSFVLMSVGLGGFKQLLVEIGLLIACGVLISRMVFLGLTGLAGTPEFWFNFAWCITAIGAYMLEAMEADRHKPRQVVRR